MSRAAATIAIDASTLVRGMTGVGYYTANIANALAEIDRTNRYILLSNRPIEYPVAPSFERNISPFPTRVGWLQLSFPRQLRGEPVDLLHFTNYMGTITTRTPYVLTVYDMTLKLFPNKHQLRRSIVLGPLQPLIARRAALIITLSESSRDDIVRILGIDREKVRVVPGAAAARFSPAIPRDTINRVRAKYALPDRYALHVGTIEPRKNVPVLLEAFSRARRRAGIPHALVLAGADGWRRAELRETIRRLGDGFSHFLGYVPEEDLPALYRGAELFVCPTSYEGFGLPNLEAMACGTPVVTTRTSSIPEVVGDAALLVPPDSIDPLADAIIQLATDERARQELATAGIERARRFSWEDSARKTLAVYREALGVHEPAAAVRARVHTASDEFSVRDWRFALARLAYHDLFEYPLTTEQLMDGLNGHVPPARLKAIIESEPLMRARTERHGDFFTLRGRGQIAAEREARAKHSQQVLRRNRGELARLGKMPFVRMVAISGSISYGNNRSKDDIDLFLIARSGRVWLTFMLLILRHKLSGKRATFCPNFIIGDGELAIRERNFYNAQQIAGLQPLIGDSLFRKFLAANEWIDRYRLAAPPDFPVGRLASKGTSVVERLLSGRLGDMIESLARRIGMARMKRKRPPAPLAVNLDRDYIKLHFIDHRASIVTQYRNRLASVGLDLEDAIGEGATSIEQGESR